jgi:hypothetical protein
VTLILHFPFLVFDFLSFAYLSLILRSPFGDGGAFSSIALP